MPALGLLQMSGLDPQSRARGARDGGETGASWQSQPGVLGEGLASFLKTPRKHESFKTAGNIEHNAGVCAPLLDAHVFPAIAEQRDEAHTLPFRRCHRLRPPRIDGDGAVRIILRPRARSGEQDNTDKGAYRAPWALPERERSHDVYEYAAQYCRTSSHRTTPRSYARI